MNTPAAPPTQRRFFTLDEANRMLPLIRRIVEELGAAARLYERTQNRLNLKGPAALAEGDRRVADAELSDHADRLEACLQELRTLGVEFKGWDGLVDFPAWVDGREVEYCWKAGEPRVEHWHEIYAGYSNRKPLPVTPPAKPDPVAGDDGVDEYRPDDVTKPTRSKAKANRKPVRRIDDML
jgi:hypothetical protein